MTLEDLTQVFANVREVLAEGGYFAFDLNMSEAFETRWKGTYAYVENDHACVVRSSKDVAQRIGNMELTIFELGDSGWNRADLTVTERWYAQDDVLDGLRVAGFSDTRSFSADEPIAEGCPTSQGRMFFVARRADQGSSEQAPLGAHPAWWDGSLMVATLLKMRSASYLFRQVHAAS